MDSYKFITFGTSTTVMRSSDGHVVPLAQDNVDCLQFLKDWEAGATVLSSTGSPLPWGSDPS